MKKSFLYITAFIFLFLISNKIISQCSICTKTASQLGEGPAKGLNIAIVYLMFTPLLIIAFLGYTWWKKEKMQ